MSFEMSEFTGIQLHIPTVKMIQSGELRTPLAVYHRDAVVTETFLEQRGEDVNKGCINRWISRAAEDRPIGRALWFPLIHIANVRQGWSKQM